MQKARLVIDAAVSDPSRALSHLVAAVELVVSGPPPPLTDTAFSEWTGSVASVLTDAVHVLRSHLAASPPAPSSPDAASTDTISRCELEALAYRDPLTGLPNRRACELALAAALTTTASQPCVIAVVDLDRFKAVNDTRSHEAGDTVLCAVANAIHDGLRTRGTGGDLVARWGGDEFVVIMPATKLPTALAVLTRITRTIAILPPEVGAGVTLSIGLCQPDLGSNPAAALAHADTAMYAAKRRGGNQVATLASETT